MFIHKVKFTAGYTKTHSLPSKFLPFEVKQLQKAGTQVIMLGHVCQFDLGLHNAYKVQTDVF